MKSDLQPDEIESVFCWRTNTGEVHPGARDTAYNGRPARYQPGKRDPGEGLRTTVLGQERPQRDGPAGFRLADQGGVSRMGCFVAGFVTTAHLVPARDGRALRLLRAAAHQGIASGAVHEWAVARIHGGGRRVLAVHLGAAPEVIARAAAEVRAPWTLTVGETIRDSRSTGTEIVVRDLSGTILATLPADTRFAIETVPRLDRGDLR